MKGPAKRKGELIMDEQADVKTTTTGSLIMEQIRQQAFEKSLAINSRVAPTTPEMAEFGHKAALLAPHNPRMILNQMYESGFSPLMEKIFGQQSIELEAPERTLAIFSAKTIEKRLLYLEYRQHKAKMLCCDQLDIRNPLFHTYNDAVKDQAVYQLSRTNKDNGLTERDYQALNMSSNNTMIDEKQTIIEPQRKKGGILSRLNPFGR